MPCVCIRSLRPPDLLSMRMSFCPSLGPRHTHILSLLLLLSQTLLLLLCLFVLVAQSSHDSRIMSSEATTIDQPVSHHLYHLFVSVVSSSFFTRSPGDRNTLSSDASMMQIVISYAHRMCLLIISWCEDGVDERWKDGGCGR